ncbi:MAG: Ig-like domain-containing protein [Saprospiraceae bacterium]
MHLKNHLKIVTTTLFLLSFLSSGMAQGIVYINRDVFIGNPQTIFPTGASIITKVKDAKHGILTPQGSSFTYSPPTYACLDTFTISYQYITSGIKFFNYASYAIRVDHSFLNLKQDYAFTNLNTTIDIPVLANDVATSANGQNAVFLNSVSLVNSGTASIVNDKIRFKPATGYYGLAYLNYVACDAMFGNCKTSAVSIQVNNVPPAGITTSQISTSKGSPIIVLTPNSGFTTSVAASNGTITFVENNAFNYVPNPTFVGQDQVTFINAANNQTHIITIDVINKTTANKYAIPDVFYTAENVPVTFDVLQNDRAVNAYVANYTNPNPNHGSLSIFSNKFTFTPAPGFNGVAKFTYNIRNNNGIPSTFNINEWTTVNIIVSNQYPSKQVFELKTPSNTPLVLNYNIPILGWNFSVVDPPQHGTLIYHPGQTSLTLNSQTSINGTNLMVYTPASGFTGTEQFELLYCINGNCRNVKFYVVVEAVTPSLSQYCSGDCVWSGDANNDGIVDIVDLLPLGYCQGETGDGRPNASIGWYGQFANNWQHPLIPGLNMKYADTDGDGEVNAADMVALDAHYGKTHNITPDKVINYKAIPLNFQILTPNPQIGDLVEVDVLLGTQGNPSCDLYGFTMEFPFDNTVINYNSFQMSFYPNSWFTYNSPTLSLAKKHSGNQVDFGIVRTGGIAATGIGKVARMSFIIDDDISGIRDQDGSFTANLNMAAGKTMSGDGSIYDIEPQVIPIKINLKKNRTSFDVSKVVTYPNPASSEVNIYVNGGYELIEYQVYNLAGQQLLKSETSGKSATVNIESLHNGIYFVKVITDGGVVTKKFEVLK